MASPLAIDLFCGLGGWAEGLLAEGWAVYGFDIERHVYGEHRYPAQLVLQDVRTLHGSQFRGAALIVASPPCQAYSYRAMPWSRARALPPPDNELFDACFRIQREACEAAGKHVPLIVENVRGAQKWVGRARWNYGSFYLWGDVPALMPMTFKGVKNKPYETGNKNTGGSWFAVANNTTSGKGRNPDGRKLAGFRFDGSGRSFQSASVEGVKGIPHRTAKHWTNPAEHEGVKQQGSGAAWWDKALDERRKQATAMMRDGIKRPGIELGEVRFNVANAQAFAHIGTSRKFASAMIAKIPLPLARHIGAVFRPRKNLS
jgi:hypothetical protein